MIASRLAAPLLAVGLGVTPAFLAGQAVPGQTYAVRMTTEGEPTLVATARESGGRLRMDFPRSREDHEGDEGHEGYLLVRDGGRTVVLVHPEEREYSVVDDTTFEQIVGKALQVVTQTGVVQVQVRDVNITPERLGPGEPISGYPTRRYRITQQFSAFVGAFGFVREEPIRQTVVTEYWVSPRLTLARNPLVELLANVATALAQKSQSFVRRSTAARDSLFRGTPLRIVVSTRSGDGDPVKQRRIEVTDLATTMLDPSIWTVPPDYRRRQGDFNFEIF